MNLSGIQFRLLLLGIAPSLLLASSLAFYFIQYHYLDLENALKDKGQVTINQLAISSIYGVFSANTEILNNITTGILSEPDIVSVHIIDSRGKTLVRSDNPSLPSTKELIHFQHPVTLYSINKNIDESLLPPSQSIQLTSSKVIGSVEIILSLENTYHKQHIYLQNSLLIIFIGLLFTITLAIKLSKSISAPIINLTKTANAIADGKMDLRAVSSNTFEINILCQSFNTMAIGLQQTQSYLIKQVDLAVSELNRTLADLEEKNKSLEKSTHLAISQNKAKSQFIAHISHEIRTPMNGVLGFIELLTHSELSPQQLEQTLLVKQSASYLLHIVNEILDYTSLETGNFKINTTPFNFRESIENCATTITPLLDKVQLIIDIDNEIPHFISSDPTRLQQILANFLGNAIKFTKQGHIIIRCHLLKNKHLLITVSDTGIGIHADKIPSLFKPFLQINENNSTNETGSGLGLSICKSIATRLGGNIGACSIHNTGSTFWLSLPISLLPDEPYTHQQKHILVIDPFKLRRSSFINQLHYLGYQTSALCNFSEFESLQTTDCFDLVFYAAINNDFESLNSKFSSISKAAIIFLTSHEHTVKNFNTLSLPCRSSFLKTTIQNHCQSQVQNNKSIQPPQPPSIASIFIADDNKINRLLLESQLETYCKNITLTSNGKEALSFLQQTKYDLILLDLQMPYFSGQEIIQIIKQAGQINENTPTIAITAHAQSKQRNTLIEAGFDECLIKPVLLEQLAEIVGLWLPKPPSYATKPEAHTINYISQLLEKTSGNPDLATTLFKKLFLELPDQTMAIKKAIYDNDFALAEQISHKLHGSVSFCGFSDIQQIAHDLETSFLNKEIDHILTKHSLLENKIDTFLSLKNSILSQLKDIPSK